MPELPQQIIDFQAKQYGDLWDMTIPELEDKLKFAMTLMRTMSKKGHLRLIYKRDAKILAGLIKDKQEYKKRSYTNVVF